MLPKLNKVQWILIGIGAIFVLTATGLAGWFIYDSYFAPEPEGEPSEEEDSSADSEQEEIDCDTIMLRDDWQTYTDTDGFGYSIRYPHDWQASEELFEGHSYWKVVFGPNGNISETAAVFIGEANYHTLEAYRGLLSHGTSPPYVLGENEAVIVDGYNATKFTLYLTGLEQFKEVLYFLEYPYIGVNRLIQGHDYDSVRSKKCEPQVFYTMIGSYKFGQEYENEECGFSFRYPISWEITEEYYYETAGGSKATSPTIHLQEVGNTESNNWIRMNPRQSDCSYLYEYEAGEEYVSGSKVTSYSNSDGSMRCIETEVPAKDKNGRSTTYYWMSFTAEEDIQKIFKQIIETFETI